MIGKCRLVTALILALACVSMWGCGLFDEEVSTSISERRGDGHLVAIIDDSLALMQNARAWHEHAESCDYWDNCDRGTMNQGLFLVNYREKKNPYWGDSIEGRISLVDGFYHDSSAMFSNANDEFGFWRIGEKPRIVRRWNCEAPCECNREKYGRPWVDGNVLLKMVQQNDCPYAVLETATGIVRKLELTGGYAWLEGCDDITYIDGDVMCVKRLGEPTGAITLFDEGNVVDSLVYDHYTGNLPVFWGEYVAAYIYKKDFMEGDLIAKFSKKGFERNFPETWKKYNSFVDSTGSSISYSSEDLIITK